MRWQENWAGHLRGKQCCAGVYCLETSFDMIIPAGGHLKKVHCCYFGVGAQLEIVRLLNASRDPDWVLGERVCQASGLQG